MTRIHSSLVVSLCMTILASVALFHTSDRVNELDQQLHDINAQIEQERQSIHVLNAEWVYLSNPARIQSEIKGHLDLQPTAPRRVADMRYISSILPVHNGVEPTQDTQVADDTPVVHEKHQSTSIVSQSPAPATHFDRVIASLNAGRINDHVILQHNAPTQVTPDRIGTLIASMGLQQ